MRTNMFFAGSGGQGVLALSKMLAEAAVEEGKEVTWFPQYFGGKRGGPAMTTVVIADEPIRCTLATEDQCDVVVAMNNSSLDRYESYLVEGGKLILNSSIVTKEPSRKDVQVYLVPADDLAERVGKTNKAANIVMCAAVAKITGCVDPENAFKTLPAVFAGKEKYLPINEAAFRAALELEYEHA